MKNEANVTINKEVLKALRPCRGSWENYLKHHADFNGDFLEFLDLENIPAKDKVWVAVRVLPREIVEIFAVDCALAATNHAAYAAYAAYAAAGYAAYAAAAYAAYAAYAADADAAYADAAADAAGYASYAADAADAERENQLDALAYLVINHNA